eukprot:CAMPEP_0196718496 /NCGR_PEP_ID=MMETSP1091-20130531/1676_1 /TAXON_ID=302021 /ORGANISM="Rhodomonas sp., Strain CCMP768" /LENGTH=323 /DNA_ID=CAMNT_0042059163 /DNA_START=49 /DNA_END=1020 /DNA_ORIENTATION=-
MCKPREFHAIVGEQIAAQRALAHPKHEYVDHQSKSFDACGLEDLMPLAWDVESWRKSVDSSTVPAPIDSSMATTLMDAEELCADIDSCLNSTDGVMQEFQAGSPSTPSSSDDDKHSSTKGTFVDYKKMASIGKWRRRDIAKHLAGERNRRAKRMGKVQVLRSILPGLNTAKPTVNQILQKAIEVLKQEKSRQKRSSEPKESFYRDVLRSSSSVASVALDSNMCVIDASQGLRDLLHWPGDEDSMLGEHISAIIHPEDAFAISSLIERNRYAPHAVGLRSSAVFSSFCSVGGGRASLAFPTGYLPRCPVSISVCGPVTTVLLEY